MSDEQGEQEAVIIEWGPCCFCGEQIARSKIDPCQLTVETEQGKWQTWFCHAACFKERLVQRPELLGFLDPAHF